jgi:hypothetical protein
MPKVMPNFFGREKVLIDLSYIRPCNVTVIFDTRKKKEKSSSNLVLVVVTCLSASLGILPRMPFLPVAALLRYGHF